MNAPKNNASDERNSQIASFGVADAGVRVVVVSGRACGELDGAASRAGRLSASSVRLRSSARVVRRGSGFGRRFERPTVHPEEADEHAGGEEVHQFLNTKP